MTKNRLIAFGCSNTFGEGLPDCWIKSDFGKNYMYGPTASKFAWPSVLSEKLNLDCVNLAKPSVSNKWICNEILNTDFVPTDTVVILWTYFSRSCIFQDDGSNKKLFIQSINNQHLDLSIRKYNKDYYKKYYTNTDAIIETYRSIELAKYYLDSLGVKNFHYSCDRADDRGNISFGDLPTPKWSTVTLPPIRIPKLDAALDNQHPGVVSHSVFAKLIIKHSRLKKIIKG